MKILLLCISALYFNKRIVNGQAQSPVEKVVQLLSDLRSRVTQDGKVEQQVYDKHACWCDKTTHRKATDIKKAEQDLRALGQQILQLKGRVATLTSEMGELDKDIEENKKAQELATAIRQTENADYMAETAEIKQAMVALEKAVDVLIGGTSLLQGTVATHTMKAVLNELPPRALLKDEQMLLLEKFADGKTSSALDSSDYQPQSLTVQGILTDMYKTFASDLESSTSHEAGKNTDFESLIATKERQCILLEQVKARKEEQKVEAESLLAQATQGYDDTTTQMKADIKFFDETKTNCEEKHREWIMRSSARTQEMNSIEKAIDILDSDEARETFASAMKPALGESKNDIVVNFETSQKPDVDIESFLQVSSDSSIQAHVVRAYSALKVLAAKSHSLRFAQLAASVRLAKVGHFDRVLTAIDEMLQTLESEGAADIEKRDQCKDEYHKINSTISKVEWKVSKNVAKIDKLETLVGSQVEEKFQTIEGIAQVTKEIKDMETQRASENQAFLAAKTHDTTAIKMLQNARSVLMLYYNGTDIGPIQGEVDGRAFIQESANSEPVFDVSADQRPDAVFSNADSHKTQAKNILSILTMIIEDINNQINNGMKEEEAAQLDFEKLVSAAKGIKEELNNKKINLEDEIANLNKEMTEEDILKKENEGDIKDEINYRKSISADCDFILGAFHERASKRAAEVNGLTTAKEFLSSSFVQTASRDVSFLQRRNGPRELPNIHFLALSLT